MIRHGFHLNLNPPNRLQKIRVNSMLCLALSYLRTGSLWKSDNEWVGWKDLSCRKPWFLSLKYPKYVGGSCKLSRKQKCGELLEEVEDCRAPDQVLVIGLQASGSYANTNPPKLGSRKGQHMWTLWLFWESIGLKSQRQQGPMWSHENHEIPAPARPDALAVALQKVHHDLLGKLTAMHRGYDNETTPVSANHLCQVLRIVNIRIEVGWACWTAAMSIGSTKSLNFPSVK